MDNLVKIKKLVEALGQIEKDKNKPPAVLELENLMAKDPLDVPREHANEILIRDVNPLSSKSPDKDIAKYIVDKTIHDWTTSWLKVLQTSKKDTTK